MALLSAVAVFKDLVPGAESVSHVDFSFRTTPHSEFLCEMWPISLLCLICALKVLHIFLRKFTVL